MPLLISFPSESFTYFPYILCPNAMWAWTNGKFGEMKSWGSAVPITTEVLANEAVSLLKSYAPLYAFGCEMLSYSRLDEQHGSGSGNALHRFLRMVSKELDEISGPFSWMIIGTFLFDVQGLVNAPDSLPAFLFDETQYKVRPNDYRMRRRRRRDSICSGQSESGNFNGDSFRQHHVAGMLSFGSRRNHASTTDFGSSMAWKEKRPQMRVMQRLTDALESHLVAMAGRHRIPVSGNIHLVNIVTLTISDDVSQS